MNRKLTGIALLTGILLLWCSAIFAQRASKPAELVRNELQRSAQFTPLRTEPSAAAQNQYRAQLAGQVREYTLFSFARNTDMAQQKNGNLELTLPALPQPVTLLLVPVNIFASGFSANTSSGEKISVNGQYYQGIIKGDEKSLAAISIFDDEIAGFISSSRGNYVVGKLRNTGNAPSANIIYKDAALLAKSPMGCATPEIALPTPPAPVTALTNRCVRIYYETEDDFYVAFGNNAAAVTNYVTNLFNQNKTLYNNDGVSVSLSQVLVWTTTDPYSGASSAALLSQFQATRTSFNGDIGQLITTRAIGGGMAAVINGLCSTVANRLCVSGDLTTSVPNVPTFSWEVYVTTHEMGHLMGSRHSHACVWNGNNTAIDGCGQAAGYFEGSCATGPIPATGGTIMSYCHLNAVGVNFNNGFGPLPAAQIRNTVEASACLGSCPTQPPTATCCGPVSGLSATNITTTTATISWGGLSNATNYILEYRVAGSTSWISLGTTTATSLNLSGLTQATQYEWRVKANCDEAASYFAVSSFTTCAPCSAPANPVASNVGGTSATVSWTAVSGANNYTVEYRVAVTGTWTVLSPVTATSVTLTGLTPSTQYEWRVKANCNCSGSAYASGTFTTTVVPCGTPTGLISSVDDCAGYAYLSWNTVPGATSYQVERKLNSATTWTVEHTAWPDNNYEVYGFGTYNWRIKANCPGGSGEYSAVSTYICRFNRYCDLYPRIGTAKPQIVLNPQPAEHQVSISFNWVKPAQGTIYIRNQYGVNMVQIPVRLNQGMNKIDADISRLKPGIYIVQVLSEGQSISRSLVVGNQ
ncbi:MAG: fibronectin type III domain-containing protein [Dinghuibacter sp.]|nr:fibronectin type III domain-containing protein [Dinghuibacter sp.]